MGLRVDYKTMGNISFGDIKRQICNQLYYDYYCTVKNFPNDDNIEDDKNHGVPMMNKVFYEMFISRRVIPSWMQFMRGYEEMYTMNAEHGLLTFKVKDPKYHYLFKKEPLEKKILRAYMSFLKEPFVLYWFYNKGFTSAYWSLEADKAGYDVVVPNSYGEIYGIKIYSNTDTARKYANIKKHSRNKLFKDSRSIALTTEFDTSVKFGDTYTFSDALLNQARRMIELGIKPVNIYCNEAGHTIIEPGIIL